ESSRHATQTGMPGPPNVGSGHTRCPSPHPHEFTAAHERIYYNWTFVHVSPQDPVRSRVYDGRILLAGASLSLANTRAHRDGSAAWRGSPQSVRLFPHVDGDR